MTSFIYLFDFYPTDLVNILKQPSPSGSVHSVGYMPRCFGSLPPLFTSPSGHSCIILTLSLTLEVPACMTGVIYLFIAFFRRAKARANEASEERQTPVTRLPPSRVSGAPRSLRPCASLSRETQKITPVLQVREIQYQTLLSFFFNQFS